MVLEITAQKDPLHLTPIHIHTKLSSVKLKMWDSPLCTHTSLLKFLYSGQFLAVSEFSYCSSEISSELAMHTLSG